MSILDVLLPVVYKLFEWHDLFRVRIVFLCIAVCHRNRSLICEQTKHDTIAHDSLSLHIMTNIIIFFTKLLQQFLEIRLPLLGHPLPPALPVLCEPPRKHTRVIGEQVFLEKLRVAQLLVDVI